MYIFIIQKKTIKKNVSCLLTVRMHRARRMRMCMIQQRNRVGIREVFCCVRAYSLHAADHEFKSKELKVD